MSLSRIASLARRKIHTFNELPASERAVRIATWVIITFGVGLRLNGHAFRTSPFWVDEAAWSIAVMTEPLAPLAIRPIGFLWSMRAVAQTFSPSEFWLRFLPNTSGILALLLVPYVARRLFSSPAARIITVFLFALHPALIDLSKETKPYSVEVLLHLLPLALYLRFLETERRRYLFSLLALLPLLFLFGYNIVFTYPAVLLVTLHAAFRRFGRRGAAWVIASGALCLAVSVGTYAALLRGVGGDEAGSYWGKKYGVFYRPNPSLDEASGVAKAKARLTWIGKRYTDVAALPGTRRETWTETSFASKDALKSLGRLDHGFWAVLHFVGLGFLLLRKRWDWLLLLTMPVFGVMLANSIGFWPFGAFRTNLFLCVPELLIAGWGVEALARGLRRSLAVTAVVLALTVIPGFALGFDFHAHKRTWTLEFAGPEVLALLKLQRELTLQADPLAEPQRLAIAQGHAAVIRYYRQIHPVFSRRYGDYFEHNFSAKYIVGMRSRIHAYLKKDFGFWLVTDNLELTQTFRRMAARAGRNAREACVEQYCLLQVEPRRSRRSRSAR